MKKGIIVNQEWKNEHFNVITDNEALAIKIELQNGDKVILATIYCSNGNPSLRLFRMVKDDPAFSLLHQELPQILVLCFP